MRTSFGRRAFCTLLWGVTVCGLVPRAAARPSPALVSVRIEREPVESSSLVSVGFAREVRVLEIEFRSGAIYQYLGVPQSVYEQLKKAGSKGRYFAQSIRGKYEFRRLEDASR